MADISQHRQHLSKAINESFNTGWQTGVQAVEEGVEAYMDAYSAELYRPGASKEWPERLRQQEAYARARDFLSPESSKLQDVDPLVKTAVTAMSLVVVGGLAKMVPVLDGDSWSLNKVYTVGMAYGGIRICTMNASLLLGRPLRRVIRARSQFENVQATETPLDASEDAVRAQVLAEAEAFVTSGIRQRKVRRFTAAATLVAVLGFSFTPGELFGDDTPEKPASGTIVEDTVANG